MSNIDELIIDKELLKAIGAESRIFILKSLIQRKKLLSELAKELNLSAPTVMEHLEYLVNAGLVRKIDSDRKWKYYELTDKGNTLVNKNKIPMRVLIMLGIGILALSFSMFNFFTLDYYQEEPLVSDDLTMEKESSSIDSFQATALVEEDSNDTVRTESNTKDALKMIYLILMAGSIYLIYSGKKGLDNLRKI